MSTQLILFAVFLLMVSYFIIDILKYRADILLNRTYSDPKGGHPF